MTFIPPDFLTLWEKVNQLEEDYSTHKGNYKILETLSVGQAKASTLNTLIARANLLETQCESDRFEQKKVLLELVNELRAVLVEGNESRCKYATRVLLGALLHRYFRLINKYKDDNELIKVPIFGFSFYSWDVRDCRLFKIIRSVLHLPEFKKDKSLSTDLKADLDLLDIHTVVISLEHFRDYMYEKDHYKKFNHLNEPNFKPQLEEIIGFHSERGKLILSQFKAIDFLQSFMKTLCEHNKKLKVELAKWLEVLKKDHPDLSSVELSTIVAHINSHVSEAMKGKIIFLVSSRAVKIAIATSTPEQLIEKITDVYTQTARHLMVGACCLVLDADQDKSIVDESLKGKICKILGTPDELKELTNEYKENTIKLLMKYNRTFTSTEKLELDTRFFGDFSLYETKLSQLEEFYDKSKKAAALLEDIVVGDVLRL